MTGKRSGSSSASDEQFGAARCALRVARARRAGARSVATLGLIFALCPPTLAQIRTPARDSAEIYHLRGLAYLDASDAKIPSPFGILGGITLLEDFLRIVGRDRVSRAWDAFERALVFDSTHADAAIDLAKLALGSQEPSALRRADAALAGAAAGPAPPADVWLWWARVAAALGNADGAAYARRYAAEGGDPALGRLAAARAHFAAGQDSLGAVAYFAGLDDASPATVEAYHEDLGLLVHSDERAEWERAPPDERAAWLLRFWARRSAEAGVGREERVAEHYRRMNVAYERYRRTSEREASLVHVGAVSHGLHDFGLDDRGVVYLLHGEPETIVRTIAANVVANESWLYRRPEGNRVLHFAALRRAGEFVLIADPLQAMGASTVDASRPICNPLDCGYAESVLAILEDRERLDPRYALLASRFRSAFLGAKGDAAYGVGTEGTDRVTGFEMARLDLAGEMLVTANGALADDSYAPELGRPLPFYYDTYAFRGGEGHTELVVAVAVPGRELRATPVGEEGGVLYPLELEVLLVDTAAGVHVRADTSGRYYTARPLGARENLRLVTHLEAKPGTRYVHRVRVATKDPERAGGTYAGPLTLPDFGGDTLMLSDLVLGEAEGTGWRRGTVELALVPPRRFAPGTALSLFYEVYNATADAPIHTRIRVEPMDGGGLLGWVGKLFGGGRAPVELSFDVVSEPEAGGVLRYSRRLQLESARPGRYRVTVEVKSGTETVRRTTTLAIDPDLKTPDADG